MQKLRLDLEELTVESFATHAERDAAGTVRGHDGGTIGCIFPTDTSAYTPATPLITQECMVDYSKEAVYCDNHDEPDIGGTE